MGADFRWSANVWSALSYSMGSHAGKAYSTVTKDCYLGIALAYAPAGVVEDLIQIILQAVGKSTREPHLCGAPTLLPRAGSAARASRLTQPSDLELPACHQEILYHGPWCASKVSSAVRGV